MAKKNKPFYLNPLIWIVAIVLIMGIWLWSSYNNFVVLNQNIDGQWAQVETQYQRRIDLIPNLVNSVKGYMQFEKSLLEDITSLRSMWMTAGSTEDKVNYGNALDTALGRLLAVYENYPDLKSIEAVSTLMDELSGTENRISVERKRYNDMILVYNKAILVFPSNMIANMFGFGQRTYFQSTPGAEYPPVVNLTS